MAVPKKRTQDVVVTCGAPTMLSSLPLWLKIVPSAVN